MGLLLKISSPSVASPDFGQDGGKNCDMEGLLTDPFFNILGSESMNG